MALECMVVKKRVPKKRNPGTFSKLTETEHDLSWHVEHGYQLEEVIRPASANRNTVQALKERGLITEAKTHDPLKIIWRTTSRRS
jgi:hypothetical protein